MSHSLKVFAQRQPVELFTDECGCWRWQVRFEDGNVFMTPTGHPSKRAAVLEYTELRASLAVDPVFVEMMPCDGDGERLEDLVRGPAG